TATVAAKISGDGSKIRYKAAWLAPPPIHEPARVANPLHTSPDTTSGANNENNHTAKGPPNIIPIIPVKNSKPAFFRSHHTSRKLRFKVNSTKHEGSR